MIMRVKKIVSIFLVFLFVVCSVSALSIEFGSSGDGGTRSPDVTKRRDDDLVGVIIKTNVEGAEVYINGKLFGTTPIATVDLSASYYNIEIRKSGYDTIKCKIYPRRRYTYTYEFVMQKTCGFINIKNCPSGSSVYVDGYSVSSSTVEVDPGNHTVKVRKFGYEDFVERVYVENHKTVGVSVSLKVAPFRITDFKISKNKINPDYTSGIGKVNISFEVSNDGSAILSVLDRYGNEVWVKEYRSFSTWEQSVTWNGTDDFGNPLPDGQYEVNLYSFDFNESRALKIDRSMIYPLSTFTPSGSGIGSLPCAYGDGVNYVKLLVEFGPVIDMNGENAKLFTFPVNTGIIVDFAKYNEFAFSFGVGTATSSEVVNNAPIMVGLSYKRNFSVDIGSNFKFNLAGLINYNYCTEYDYCYLGSNIGTGVGLGLAAGLESNKVYFGVTGEYSFDKTRSRNNKNHNIDAERMGDTLKYGGVISVLPARNLKTSVWAAFYNNEVLEGGVEFITMPGSGAFCFDVKASILTDLSLPDKNMLINGKIGLSYLF